MFPNMCPGLYCGRHLGENGSLGLCGACQRGYTSSIEGRCLICSNDLSNYDMLFLGFMFMLPLMLHCSFIFTFYDKIKQQFVLAIFAVVELIVSAVGATLLLNPVGSLHLHTCGVRRLSDWYTLFYNPSPHYQLKLYCTHEAVYPLQTIVLLFYFFCILQLLGVECFFKKIHGAKTDARYSALYFFPLLILLHVTSCGIIYYAFPYLSIILSMLMNAWHQSKSNHSIFKLIKCDCNFILEVAGHWFLLAYGIISLKMQLALLIFVPLPIIFYYITKHYSDPIELLESEEECT